MSLTRLTITGADDGTDPDELVRLSQRFPFVEWGILFSRKREGTPRYPSRHWRDALLLAWFKYKRDCESLPSKLPWPPTFHLSAHFCGMEARETIAGDSHWLDALDVVFGRVQLNGFATNQHEHALGAEQSHLVGLIDGDRHDRLEFILQVRDSTSLMMAGAIAGLCFKAQTRVTALWDPSGGAGVVSGQWPEGPLLDGAIRMPLGNAGGINLDNIRGRARLAAYRDEETWLDLETGARVDDKFHIPTVECLLEAARPYVNARRDSCPVHKHITGFSFEACPVCENST